MKPPPSSRPLETERVAVRRVGVHRHEHGVATSNEDEVAVERPLTIRMNGETLAITMRTPGHDRQLVAGFLVAEGWVTHPEDLVSLERPDPEVEPGTEDVIVVKMRRPVSPSDGASRRGTLVSSACGVCGRTELDDLLARCTPVHDDTPWTPHVVAGLTGLLSEHQPVFRRTGGVHGAALIRRENLEVVAYEDVGRHNAVDKVIGETLLSNKLPASGHALVVSGRTSFEIVQKAIAASVPLVAGVSAPSSLSIEMAERAGLTLIGFSRGRDFNVYAGAHRLGG